MNGVHISRQEELAIYEASDGLCAICYEEPARHIDHNHVTGEVRGALCGKCNRGMGLFGDDIERLRSAVQYLEEPFLIEA